MIFSNGAKRSERASERTPPAKEERRDQVRTNGRSTDVEIEHLKKLCRDLRTGLSNLNELHPRPYNYIERVNEHGAKLAAAENKIFKLRQARLL